MTYSSQATPLAAIPRRGYNLPVPTAAKTIRVKVLFFGRLKEITGRTEDSVNVAEGSPIDSLFTLYEAQYPELRRYRGSVVASRNQEFARWTASLNADDEVGFLPPVSGG